MTPQENELVTELFDRLAKLETTPRDPEAERLIADGTRRAPHAVYALVQTTLLQDEALKRANARIEELQAQVDEPPQPGQRQGSFLELDARGVWRKRAARFGAERARPKSPLPKPRHRATRHTTCNRSRPTRRRRDIPGARLSAPADRSSAPQPRPPRA